MVRVGGFFVVVKFGTNKSKLSSSHDLSEIWGGGMGEGGKAFY